MLPSLCPEPRQLFGEQRHALAPRAGHARDVGAPEPARGAEVVIELAQLVVDVAKRVRLIGVARRAGGFHRDVGVRKLVAFKVRAALVVVDAVPKNANGKLDRDALAAVWQRQQRGA